MVKCFQQRPTSGAFLVAPGVVVNNTSASRYDFKSTVRFVCSVFDEL